jgi:hypothetical protein
MNPKYTSALFMSILVILINLVIAPGILHAQYPKNDTLRKIIVLGGDTYIRFDDPNNRPFHVELSVVSGDPKGLKIYYPVTDSQAHRSYAIGGMKVGEYLVRVKYQCQSPGFEADSGIEYVHISVLLYHPFFGKSFLDSTFKQAPDISKIIPVDVSEIYDLLDQSKNYYYKTYFVFTPTKIYEMFGGDEYNPNINTHDFWEAPKGRRIVEVSPSKGESNILNILLDDGTIYRATHEPKLGFADPVELSRPPNLSITEYWIDVKGDALYLRSSGTLYVSRDYSKTWLTDTTGLNGAIMNAIELDSSQNVYIATSTSLFKQGPNDNSWTAISSLTATYISSLFIDRFDRIFASNFLGVYMSSNRGNTWITDTAGLSGDVIQTFGDDAYGNIYATTISAFAPNKLLRSLGGTGAWTEIAQSVRALAVDSSNTGVFHSVAGDSTILLGTLYGLFFSTDRGNTWAEANTGLPSTNFYNLVKNTDGSVFLSSNRGIYNGTLNDSSNWKKIYPVNGYMNGPTLFKDIHGVLYTLGPARTVNYNTVPPFNYISTDNGKTWSLDTLGIGAIPLLGLFYVESDGVQHIAVQQYNNPLHLYSKTSAAAWKLDENGFSSSNGDFAQSFGSDRQGNLYFSTSNGNTTGMLWKRTSAGDWSPDTSGLNGDIVYNITGGLKGDKYGIGYSQGIVHSDGSSWSRISVPAGLGNVTGVSAISVDSSGALFAAYASGSDVTNEIPNGVYFTTNNGANWSLAGLDGIVVSKLISFGDTTYALASEGIFSLTRQAASAVPIGELSTNTPYFSIYPNPDNGEATVSYVLYLRARVRIELINSLGQQISTIYNDIQEQGQYEKKFDTRQLANGSYFIRLTINGFSSAKMMCVEK